MHFPRHVIVLIASSLNLQELCRFLTVAPIFAHHKSILCKQLQTLQCQDVNNIAPFISHVKSFPSITSLDFSQPLNAPNTEVHDAHIVLLATHYTTLKHLNLSNCVNITDKCADKLAATNNVLETLAVANCHSLTEFGVLAIVETCPQLTHLDLSGCGDRSYWSLLAIADCCPMLKWLDVHSCYELNDTGFHNISLQCLHLEHLNVSNCSEISKHGIGHVVQNCKKLKYLNISNCDELEDECIMGIDRIETVVK